MTTDAGRARPRAGLRRRHLGLGLRPQPARRAHRRQGRACSPTGPTGCAAHASVEHASAILQQVQENKFYADLAGTRTTQQRVRMQPGFEAMGTDEATGVFDSMSTHRAAGRPRLGVPHRRRLRLGRRAGRGARAAGREAGRAQRRGRQLRPRHPPVQPVADHPRVDRARHRARPGAGLRGQLRRHVVRDLRQARHPAVRLGRHERHRRPHRRARPRRRSATTTRASQTQRVGHRQGRRPRRLPARPVDGPHEARAATTVAPTAARTPTPPATSRSSGWPTCRCSPHPTGPAPTS